VEELYGTYLTFRVLELIKNEPQSIKSISDKLAPTLSGRELHNLKYRIRSCCKKLVSVGFIQSQWRMDKDGSNAYKQYSIYKYDEFKSS
jgi:hypothetical protein